MKILIPGYDTPGALERYCAAALQSAGHSVSFCDLREELYRYSRLGNLPVLAEAEISLLRRRYNRTLLNRVRVLRPDLLLVFKGSDISAITLQAIRRLPGAPALVNWNPDSPFDYATANTNRETIRAIPLYDIYFIWDHDLFHPLQEAGARQVAYLPFGYDPVYHRPVDLSPAQRDELASDVCFVGGYTPERAALLERLAHHRVRLWGPNWERLAPGSPLQGCLM
ncbi:MAG: hypothetical protein IT326_06220, partial [Anaerolineae bacterium]|nr:hypothetical protein [Anaerolineae bacterium]